MPTPHPLTLALGAALLGASTGVAAATDPATEAASRKAAELDAVEVRGTRTTAPRLRIETRTGSRLGLTTGELPVSVDVVDLAAQQARGEVTLGEALDGVPGVVSGYSFGVLNLAGRGFSGVFNSPTLFDGIRYPGWQVSPRLTLNYAQVAVLRGPAALAAGQGALAGAIDLTPRRADGTDSPQALLGFGRYGTTTVSAGRGGTLAEGLYWRADLSRQGSDQRGSFGYARDTSFEYWHGSGELALALNEAWTLSLSAESFEDEGEGYFGSPLIGGRVDPSLREINYNVVDDRIRMQVDWLRLRAEWQPGSAWSGRVVAFANDEDRYYRNAEAYTFQPASGRVRRSDYLEIAHTQAIVGLYGELAWTGELAGRPHRLVAGVQIDRNDHDRFNDSPFRYTDTVDLRPLNRGVYTSLDRYGPRTVTDIEQRGVFFESALDLSERVRLVSGARHDRTEVDSLNVVSGVRFDKSYSSTAWRLGPTFRPWDAGPMFYASWATSSEPPAQITTLGLANASFDLTRGRQVEIGAKGEQTWGDWTLAAYDLVRSNILSRDPADPNRLIQIGRQRGRGVEASWRAELATDWTLEGHASVLDAEFLTFDERVGTALISRRGNTPPAVPERMASSWLHWQANERWRFGAGVRAVGRSAGDNANTVFLPGYATVDLSASWQTDYGPLTLRVRNLDDRVYASRPYNAAQQVMLGEPRLYELTWRYAY